ncbi:Protein LONG AFTER FAR-RED 3 [Hirschfeldia incana]|nr:Protein LONG AFTER FAR-RED 3 [Hirschfeldia incana]
MNRFVIISAAVFLLISLAYLPLLNQLYWSTLTSLIPPVRVVADLLVTNGTIFTSDASSPFADSMAIRNGRVLKVGSFTTLKDFVGDGTVEVNLEGKVVVPGLIDSHVHLISGGVQMAQVGLRGVSQKEEFCRMVKDAVKNAKEGSWILGGGWNNDFWGGELPSASWIDEISPHNPVWLIRMDGHMGLANSLTLKIAGVTSLTEDPVGGTIMRLPSGEPTGLLIESAMELVTSFVKEVSVDERREALLRASKYALTRGVTTVVDLGRYYPGTTDELSWNDFQDVYLWADSAKKMIIRTCLFFPITTWSRLVDLKLQKGDILSEWLYLGGVKAFIDGSLGSNSALFYEEYLDTPNNHGLEVMDPEILSNLTMSADKSGLQVAIHAIGDKANDIILDMYESVAAANGERDRRVRIEHAQHLAPGSSARFGQHHIVASVQPDHLLDDADTAPKKLGFDRAGKESYLFQSLLNGNALVAFGSDWPVADINPLHSMRTAVKRLPPKWDHAWIPSECISFTDALTAHTISAARAAFLDQHLGSLSPGKLADFVILSTSSWDEFSKHGSASVLATYVGGKQVHP